MSGSTTHCSSDDEERSDVQIEMTEQAAKLLAKKGGAITIDFIRATG